MFILFYTLLILVIGLTNKAVMAYSGSYSLSNFLTDLPLIIFIYFGLLAIWGRARNKRYLSKKFWHIYFIALMVSIVAIPFFNSDLKTLAMEESFAISYGGYLATVLILLPYYWGLYSYIFGKNNIWKINS